MKCGICGTEEIEVISGKEVIRTRPIRDSGDLWRHKRASHLGQLEEQKTTRRKNKEEKDKAEQEEKADRDRRRQAAGKPAVTKQRRSYNQWQTGIEWGYTMGTTAKMQLGAGKPTDPADQYLRHRWPARYPEPEIYSAWEHARGQIAQLEEDCERMCELAWETGSEISDADIDAVIQAGE